MGREWGDGGLDCFTHSPAKVPLLSLAVLPAFSLLSYDGSPGVSLHLVRLYSVLHVVCFHWAAMLNSLVLPIDKLSLDRVDMRMYNACAC